MRVCLYHNADLDGQCSGALVKLMYPDCVLIGVNYGDPVPDLSGYDDVCIVDFSFDVETMLRINNLIWIDHHITAINDPSLLHIRGLRSTKFAACELTYSYFYQAHLITPVRLLGRYDIWDHSNPDVLPFQYGCRLHDTDPVSNMQFWNDLLVLDVHGDMVQFLIKQGETCIAYQKQQDLLNLKSAMTVRFEGYEVPCLNVRGGSEKFCGTLESFGILFHRIPGKWVVSLRSAGDFDVSVLAKKHGGGGHKGAAGFTCIELPFEELL